LSHFAARRRRGDDIGGRVLDGKDGGTRSEENAKEEMQQQQ
jgi:hypothetical protein